MKKRLLFASTFVIVGLGLRGWALGAIPGSKHDFAKKPWSKGDACGACHTPQRPAAPKVAPLWDPGADLTRRFGAATEAKDRAGNGTLACLRCHDGTVAPPAVSGSLRTQVADKRRGSRFQPAHGSSNHPVGKAYPRMDPEFRPMSFVTLKGTVILPGGNVECISCHDPHNGVDQKFFLVTSNARSALCLTCHRK